MLAWIREKFGTAVIGTIISLIAFVFVFYGVFSPKATRGLHEGSVAGTVNGDSISIAEFSRELNRRVDFLKSLRQGQALEDQLVSQLRQSVFQDLANRRMMIQEAERKGLIPADEEVREKIREIPAFQKDGKFDILTYKQVLESNNYTAGGFERMIREDARLNQWESYFKDRVHVSDEESKREFLISEDKRSIQYVLLTPEAAKKAGIGSVVPKSNQSPAAASTASNEKDAEEIQKWGEKISDKVLATWSATPAAETKINALLTSSGVSIKKTGLVNRQNSYLPGIGDAKAVLKDAFLSPSPINPKENGKAKKYVLGDKILVAWIADTQKPDLNQLEKMRGPLIDQLSRKKASTFYQEWMKKLNAKAKIDLNPTVISGAQ